MQPLSIVVAVQKLLDMHSEILQIAIFLAVNLFLLQSLHEAFTHRVAGRLMFGVIWYLFSKLT
jgi:hypothetical protein